MLSGMSVTFLLFIVLSPWHALGKSEQTLAATFTLPRALELPVCQAPASHHQRGIPLIRPTHSHVDLCPSIMLEAGGLGCAARWGCFVRGLCFSQLCGSCYPPVLQNTRKELSGRDVSLLVPQPPKRDGAPYAFSEMILQRVIERLRHGSLWRMWKQRAQCLWPAGLRGERSQTQLCFEAR